LRFQILPDSEKIHRLKIILAFLVIYFVWGSTYIAIRFAIDSIPPYLMAGFRFTLSGLILYLWQIRKDAIRPRFADIRKSVIVGLLLSGVDRTVLLSKAQPGTSVFFYAATLILAGLSWASGSLYSRTIRSSASLLKIVSIQMLAGGMVLLLIGLFKGEWQLFSPEAISGSSFLSLLYLIIFGSIITYSAYNWLLRQTAPAKVGTYAFFNPLVAVFLGWLLAGEPVTVRMMIGASAILTAVLLVNQSRFFQKKNTP
jgi:drug/metabolite transporter (DMT)-like permease